MYPASGFQPAKDSPGPRPFPSFPVVFGFTSFSVVSATRSFWRTILGRHVLVLALFGSVHGEPPERAYVVGFVVSGRTGVFHEFHVSGRSVSRIYILVCVLRHTRILVPSLPETVAYLFRTLDKARADAHCPAG